ncbi:hypothetical protein [Janibacter hoylei]|uniref:hypothetical protein n=1 Tax=Janibacter hoylei TaxID=364298 RepID=UPI002493AFA5|nr:hypothetical protein [Janibacter hoylei]
MRLIAFNIDPDRAGLHLGSDRRTIRLDETLWVGGTRYTVAELVPTHPARGEHANGCVPDPRVTAPLRLGSSQRRRTRGRGLGKG